MGLLFSVTAKGGSDSADMSSYLGSSTGQRSSGIKARKEAGTREVDIGVVTGNLDGLMSELAKATKVLTDFGEAQASQSEQD